MKNTRMTNQRLKIIEHLKSVKTHPTAEMVHKEVVKELPQITLATVYRNLNILTKQGKAIKLEINNEFRFDGATCKHQHCVCNQCGKIVDIFQPEISEYAMKKMNREEFNPGCVNIIYTGTCKKCGGVKK